MLSNQIKRLTKPIDYIELTCDSKNPDLSKLIELFSHANSLRVSFLRCVDGEENQVTAKFVFVDKNMKSIETDGFAQTESAIRKEIQYCLARYLHSRLRIIFQNPATESFPHSGNLVTRIGFDLSRTYLDYDDEILLIEFGSEKTPVFIVPTKHSGNLTVSMDTMLECVNAY